MRAERDRKLAGEDRRWFDVSHGGLFGNQAGLNDSITRDPNFSGFRLGVSKLLTLPQTNINLDPAIRQNPCATSAGSNRFIEKKPLFWALRRTRRGFHHPHIPVFYDPFPPLRGGQPRQLAATGRL